MRYKDERDSLTVMTEDVQNKDTVSTLEIYIFYVLEIAKSYRTVVCPTVDFIDHNDFHYRGVDPYIRGTFDWNFDYKERAITQKMRAMRDDPTEGVKYVALLR